LGVVYDASEWRLFIDSSKRSLKGVLLHSGNKYASVPVAHSIHLKETYESLEILLNKKKYKDHGWVICGDSKVLCMLLGQQPGCTKFPCFFYVNGTAEPGVNTGNRSNGQAESPNARSKNIARESLVDPQKILLPPLHIKLGLMSSL
jgi:hypothetical protein